HRWPWPVSWRRSAVGEPNREALKRPRGTTLPLLRPRCGFGGEGRSRGERLRRDLKSLRLSRLCGTLLIHHRDAKDAESDQQGAYCSLANCQCTSMLARSNTDRDGPSTINSACSPVSATSCRIRAAKFSAARSNDAPPCPALARW